MISAGTSQLHDIVKRFMKLRKLRGLTGAVTTSRRRRLTMSYSLMSQQSKWSATEGRTFRRRHPEYWSTGINIHWKSMCGEEYWNREPPLWSSLGSWTPPNTATFSLPPFCLSFKSSLMTTDYIKITIPNTQSNAFSMSLKGTAWHGRKAQPKALTWIQLNWGGDPWKPTWETRESPRTSRNCIRTYWKMLTPAVCARYIDHLQKVHLSIAVVQEGGPLGYWTVSHVCDILLECTWHILLTIQRYNYFFPVCTLKSTCMTLKHCTSLNKYCTSLNKHWDCL